MRHIRLRDLAVAATITLGFSPITAMADGDPAAGKRVFLKCRACHNVDQEKNRVGPHLVGIVGRASASVDGFRYSPAMRDAGLVWDEETLAAYLTDPRGYIKGNRMTFPGLRKEQEIADVIAYLKDPAAAE